MRLRMVSVFSERRSYSDVLPAKEHEFDVVLVDTAGRMQDNEPLMRALAKVSLCTLSGLIPL